MSVLSRQLTASSAAPSVFAGLPQVRAYMRACFGRTSMQTLARLRVNTSRLRAYMHACARFMHACMHACVSCTQSCLGAHPLPPRTCLTAALPLPYVCLLRLHASCLDLCLPAHNCSVSAPPPTLHPPVTLPLPRSTRAASPHASAPPQQHTPPPSSTLQAPPDPILAVGDAWRADSDVRKLNLGVGAYRTEVRVQRSVVGK